MGGERKGENLKREVGGLGKRVEVLERKDEREREKIK